MPGCLTRGSTKIDKLPFKREATAFLQLCETQDMTCPFTQFQTVLVTRHRVTEYIGFGVAEHFQYKEK